jgi:exodeoxyribonuclease VII small subunit
MPKSPPRAQLEPKSFEDALAELEHILSAMEAGNTPLEESLIKYERGNFLIQYCRTVLGSAEKQIELLSKDAAGQLVSTPMNDKPGDGE